MFVSVSVRFCTRLGDSDTITTTHTTQSQTPTPPSKTTSTDLTNEEPIADPDETDPIDE